MALDSARAKAKAATLSEEDYAELETMFAAPLPAAAGSKKRAASSLRTSVLDLRRATGVGITMSRLGRPWQEVSRPRKVGAGRAPVMCGASRTLARRAANADAC